MDLFKDILTNILRKGETLIEFINAMINTQEIVELECYQALQKIKAIMEDDSLADAECFLKIEEIVCVFEDLGSNAGNRHDFG